MLASKDFPNALRKIASDMHETRTRGRRPEVTGYIDYLEDLADAYVPDLLNEVANRLARSQPQ